MQIATTLSPADVELRRGRITSTRIVKLVKGHRLAVFNDMMGISPPFKDNARMRFGRKLERTIIEAAAEDRGWGQEESPTSIVYQPGTVAHGRYATSVDALVERIGRGDFTPERVIEAKNRGAERAHEYASNEPLEDEIVQTQWHMLVTDVPLASVCVLLGGNDLRIFDLVKDDELGVGLREIADRFLRDHIDAGKPPEMDASDAAADYLRANFPTHRGPMIQATEEIATLAEDLRHQRAMLKDYEALALTSEHRLKALIGEAEGVEGPGFRLTWKATKPTKRTDWEALALSTKPDPETIAKFTAEKPGARRFLATFKETP